jgi:hypothetical protein
VPDNPNAALVRRAVEAIWNRCELDVADELFAADYVNHDGLIPDLVRGPEAIKVSVALYRRAFPDLHIAVDELTTDREIVVLRWTARRQDQRLLTGTTRTRVSNGKIGESWTEWNRAPWLRELGILRRDEGTS